jgi:hypothetical protein
MTLGEIKESFYAISGQVSDLTRKLALAGIAIIWIFKTFFLLYRIANRYYAISLWHHRVGTNCEHLWKNEG